MLCIQLDKRISKYCSKRDIVYTRYADDLTFSSNNRVALKSIYGMIKKIIDSEGFNVNEDKTRFLTPKVRKTVTGVVVNNHYVKAPSQLKRQVRAMIHKSIVTGDYSQNDKIRGYVAYINSIEPNYLERAKKYIESFSKKDVCLFKETVDAFNKNKIYGSIKSFQYLDAASLTDIDDIDNAPELENEIYCDRVEFLNKRKIPLPEYLNEGEG